VIASVASPAAHSQVTTIFSYSFSHPNGDAASVSGGTWTAHSEVGNSPIQINNGTIVLAQGAGAREDINALLGDVLSASESFTATFSLIVTGRSENSDFASFMTESAGAVAARLFIGPPLAGGTIRSASATMARRPISAGSCRFHSSLG
jgi:hypothetical protein